MSVNKVILLGRVGKQPEIKQVGDNKVANFSLATSEKFKDKSGNKVENTEWHNVVFWGKQAELIEQYVGKGDELYIEGSIKTETYEKDGEKRYAMKIKGSAITFVSKAKKEGEAQHVQGERSTKQYEEPIGMLPEGDLPF
jgi:single-strand DNA-binding protein